MFYAGIIGIDRADKFIFNECINSTTVECTLNNDTQSQMRIASEEFTYWLAGTTGCCFLFALISAFSFWALLDTLHWIRK